jgi:ABC-type lipoprotein export system ATPase subunit
MPDPPEPLIKLENIRKTYDLGETKVNALRGVSLTIFRGEYVALMGPSGSGKSTLMNTIGCLDHPTSGSYLLDGLEVVTMTPNVRAELRSNKIGFVFQNFNLLARTSALENAELPLLYGGRKMPARQRHARAREVLQSVGLGDRLGHHPGQLSGGQQQRVAIARALVNKPAILMADEPTGNLDSRTSKEVMNLFQELNAVQGITILLVTHDPSVARYAKRVMVLRDGHIVEDTPDHEKAIKALQTPDLPDEDE